METTNFSTSIETPGSVRAPMRWRRWLVGGLLVAVMPLTGVTAAHAFPALGSWGADTLRSMVGVDNVADLEDAVYQAKDAVNRTLRSGQAPKTYWDTSASIPAASVLRDNERSVNLSADDLPSEEHGQAEPSDRVWSLLEASVPFASVEARGDGKWVPLAEGASSSALRKTLIHPDPKRSWSELFVVAIDLEQVNLNWMPGRREPLEAGADTAELARPGKIPEQEFPRLLAAFNGGFKTEHGHYGASSGGVILVPAKARACSIAMSRDGKLSMGTHSELGPELGASGELAWLRQTPNCMVEGGKLHKGLQNENNKNWGATLDGGTVIRRSALGMSADGRTLFMGISNDTTARALALGMQSAGAWVVAQLDVNYSYPKFVTYEQSSEGKLQAASLVDGFVMHDQQYLSQEARDFFYLTER